MIKIGNSEIKKVPIGSTPISEVWVGGTMLWPSAGLSLSADRAVIYWYNGAPYLYVNVIPTLTVGSTITHPNVSYSYSTNLLEYQGNNVFKGKAAGGATISATYSYGGKTYTSNTLNISVEDYFECTCGLSTGTIYWYSGANPRTAQLSYVLKKNGSTVSGIPTYSIKSGNAYVSLNTSTGLITGKATGGPCTFGCVVAYGGKNYTATPTGIAELRVGDWVSHSLSVTPTSATIYTDGSYTFSVLYHTKTNGVDSTQGVTADSWEFVDRALTYSGNTLYGNGFADTYHFCARYGDLDSNYVSMVVKAHSYTYAYEFNISPLTVELETYKTAQLGAHYQKIEYKDGQFNRVVEDFDVVKQDFENLTWIYDNNFVDIHDITAVLTARKETTNTIVSAEYKRDGKTFTPEQTISVKITAPAPVYEPVKFWYDKGGYYLDDGDPIEDASSTVIIEDKAENLHQYEILCDDKDIYFEMSGNTITFTGVTSSTIANLEIYEESSNSTLYCQIRG